MNTLRGTLSAIAIGGLVLQASAADSQGVIGRMQYRDARTWHEQFMQGEPTKAQRTDAMRSLIRASPVGERGLRHIYKNFEGKYAIDPRIPGVEKSVLLQLSGSQSQAKGYRREVLYAVAFHNDPRYSVVAMNRPLKRSWGNTDADLVLRHNATGLFGRVEIKDYSVGSQVTNQQYLKDQIDKMSREGRKTGQLQFWVNRREIIPDIQQYALRKGVVPLGNVSTGRPNPGVTMSSLEAMDEVDRHFFKGGQNRTILGGGQAAYGAWKLVEGIPIAWKDFNEVWDPSARSKGTWLRLGEHGSSVLAGGTMVLAGGSLTAGQFVAEGTQARLYSIGRVGGIASIAALGASEAFLVARYANGDVTSREFWTTQWVMGSAAAGTYAGGWIGGIASAAILKNPVWGAGLGGGGGTWAGQKFGDKTAQAYYDWKFGKLDQEFGKWVYAKYDKK